MYIYKLTPTPGWLWVYLHARLTISMLNHMYIYIHICIYIYIYMYISADPGLSKGERAREETVVAATAAATATATATATTTTTTTTTTATLWRGTFLGPPPTGHVLRFIDSGVFVLPVGGPSRSLLEVRGAPWVALPAKARFRQQQEPLRRVRKLCDLGRGSGSSNSS